MVLNVFLLIIGFILLLCGGEIFVKESSNLAKKLKISPIIVGLTLCAIGTSLPELYVSISSKIKGLNDLSIGNIIGSNIFDIFIVLGVAALFNTININDDFRYNKIPLLVLINTILIIFSFVIVYFGNSRPSISAIVGQSSRQL